jgi:hypothetical protein
MKMKTQEQLLRTANTMIKEGKEAREKFVNNLMLHRGQALESADNLFIEMAKLELGEFLHGQVVGTQNVQMGLIIESLEGFVTTHATSAFDHSSSECSNMMKKARLQVAARLLRDLKLGL